MTSKVVNKEIDAIQDENCDSNNISLDSDLDCSQFQENTRRKRTCSELTNNGEDNNSSNFSSTPTPKKQSKNNELLTVKLVETMEAFQTHMLNKPASIPIPVEETANSAFMKSATIILASLQPINQVRARGDIMKYLCDIQMEELSNQ